MTFEEYAPEGNKFVKEIAAELQHVEDTNQAYRIMRSVFTPCARSYRRKSHYI